MWLRSQREKKCKCEIANYVIDQTGRIVFSFSFSFVSFLCSYARTSIRRNFSPHQCWTLNLFIWIIVYLFFSDLLLSSHECCLPIDARNWFHSFVRLSFPVASQLAFLFFASSSIEWGKNRFGPPNIRQQIPGPNRIRSIPIRRNQRLRVHVPFILFTTPTYTHESRDIVNLGIFRSLFLSRCNAIEDGAGFIAIGIHKRITIKLCTKLNP